MAARPSNAEDKLFKLTFSRPELVRELLKRTAAPDLLASLNLESLAITNASYIDEQLSEHFADIVFDCRTKQGEEVAVSLLLEHKSFLPQYPPFQVFKYQINGWQHRINAKLKPAPIIPIIFYHGKDRWKTLSWKEYLQGMCPAFEPFTLDGGYVLIDLADLSDQAIQQFRFGFLKTVLMLMKHRFERQYLLENLTNILNFVEEEVELEIKTDDYRVILRYMSASLSLNWTDIKLMVKPLSKTHSAMTIIEELEQEIREEAREAGKKEGMKEGYAQKTKEMVISMLENFPGQSDEKIAKVAKVTVEYVQKMRAEQAKTKPTPKRKKK